MTFRLRRVHDLDLVAPDVNDWRQDAACAAACRDHRDPARPSWWDVPDPRLADPDDDHLAALDVCQTCLVPDACLAHADPRRDAWNIRAGMLPAAWRQAQREGAA